MLLDFEVHRCTRRCAATDRVLDPGELCYSTLEVEGANIVRKDFSAAAWKAPGEQVFAWWKFRVPEAAVKKIKLAPNDVLLELFDQLGGCPDQSDLRYVLALLLVRRRVLRVELGGAGDASDACHALTVFCAKRDASYEVAIAMPGDDRIEQIQQELSSLLVADAA
ncbi:MAG: hypothetical protein IT425_10875 [Pirellulales bacterium]|nr:hypothetical protein [Pirellulales bacterium]